MRITLSLLLIFFNLNIKAQAFDCKLYDCDLWKVIQIKEKQLYYDNGLYKNHIEIKSRDVETLNSQLQDIFKKKEDEVWINFCVDDGTNLKFKISKGSVAKKVFVGNYFDKRLNIIVQIMNNYLAEMGVDSLDMISYGGDEWNTEEDLKAQNDCEKEAPDDYKERMLNEWCELEK